MLTVKKSYHIFESETISNLKFLERGKSEAELEQVTHLKRRLRFLQRRSIYDCERYEYNIIDRLLHDDRLTSWKRIRSVRFNSNKRANIINSKPTPKEFSNFFKGMFSHNVLTTLLTNGRKELS